MPTAPLFRSGRTEYILSPTTGRLLQVTTRVYDRITTGEWLETVVDCRPVPIVDCSLSTLTTALDLQADFGRADHALRP